MLRILVNDIKDLFTSLIQNGALKVTGGTSGGATEFAIANNAAIADGSLTQVGLIDLAGLNSLGVQLTNAGSNPLTSFSVQVKANASAPWIDLASETLDFTAPAFGSPIKGSSGDLTGLGAGEDGWLNLEVSFYTKLRIMAGSTSGTSITILAGGK